MGGILLLTLASFLELKRIRMTRHVINKLPFSPVNIGYCKNNTSITSLSFNFSLVISYTHSHFPKFTSLHKYIAFTILSYTGKPTCLQFSKTKVPKEACRPISFENPHVQALFIVASLSPACHGPQNLNRNNM